ncbi:MAG: glycoside hydrolase family 10 protein [Myxococcota bacterium]
MNACTPWLGTAALLAALLGCSASEPAPEPAEPPPTDPSQEAPEPPRPRRGLWVLAEGSQRVLDDARRVEPLLENAEQLGATDLFVQVYRGGRAWYDADLADATPYRESLARGGADALALLLQQASERGLRVHAWVNVLSLSKNADAPILADLGREVVHTDRQGRSLLDYPGHEIPQPDRRWYRMGTPGVYLDPAAPGVAERLAATFAELLARYPQIEGLHLDYIRYPDVLPYAPGSRFGVGHDFGYGGPTRARFREETGQEAPFGERIGPANAWDDWRRQKVTDLVAGIAAAARQTRPGVVMSAAVWTYADRGYLVLGQDWRGWLEDGLLDLALPMSYTRDDRLLRYMAQGFAGLPYGDRIWVGLGSWLFAEAPERAVAQIGIVREAGVAGLALFSYDSIVATPSLWSVLAGGEPGDGS